MIDRHGPLAKNVFLSANFWTVWRRRNCLGKKNTMFDRKFDQIIYCFWKNQPICQEMREKLPHIQFYGGFIYIYLLCIEVEAFGKWLSDEQKN